MRRRKIKGALDAYKGYVDYIIELDDENFKNKIVDFKADKKLMLELGAGCCGFSISHAEKNPEIKYIAVEYKEELLLKAIRKVEVLGISNIKFIRGRIETIDEWFAKGMVDKIYLNFSDPWPKARHYKRRLTYRDFLSKYKTILVNGGEIEFKTDHDAMYEFTVEEMKESGFDILEQSLDLHSEKTDIITTEYEKKYVASGLKIKYLRAKKL